MTNERDTERYQQLPDPIRLEDTVEVYETEAARDPDSGRDPRHDAMLRNAGIA